MRADGTTVDETRRTAAVGPAIRDAIAQFLREPKAKPRRKRSAEAVAADTLWWYWMECYKRSPWRESIPESSRQKADLVEEVRTAPVLPVDTDGESWVTLKIDVRLPRKAILALVEEALQSLDGRELRELKDHPTRQAVELILQRLRQTPPTPFARILLPKRIRKESLQERLTVWDMIHAGTSMVEAGRRLRKSESDVRDLYRKAALDICGEPPQKGRRGHLLVGFDPTTHTNTCPTCRVANREEDYCAAWRAYLNQDYVSLRERSVRGFSDIGDLAAVRALKSRRKARRR